MNRIGVVAAAAAASVFAAPVGANVKVIGESVGKSEICPGASTGKCVINNVGTTSTYVAGNLKYITLDADKKPEVEQYLGHLHTASMGFGEPYCQNRATNVFKDFATARGIPYLSPTHPYDNRFHIKSKVSKRVSGTLDLDAKAAAIAAGVPAAQLDQVAAAINSAYSRARTKDMEVYGWYRVYQINPDILTVFNSDDATAELKACRDWLKANNRKVIWTLTGYQLDEAKVTTDFTSTFQNQLTAALNGQVDAGKIAAITAAYNAEVARKAMVSVSPHFGLLTIATAPAG